MPTWMRHQLLIIAATAVVMFSNLGGPRLWDRDEPRNAGCAAEMLTRGDWVVPVFNDELRTHKPVLLYWLMMSAYEVFGVSEFAARFWSALLSVGTVLMTYHMGRRLFDERAGLWSALALAPALMFSVAGRAATPDAVLIFCSTLAIFLYVQLAFPNAVTVNRSPQFAWWQAALIYAAMGLAILAKGPVGLVLPTAVIGMFLLIARLPETTQAPGNHRWLRRLWTCLRPFAPLHFLRTCWAMRPLTALGVALAIALPWYVWVHLRTEGAWTEGFFYDHNLNRATQAMEGHRGSILFYPAALLVGLFPFSVFLAPLARDLMIEVRRKSAWRFGYIFALCWVGVYVALFSLAKTKLPSYITPCYPGAALLIGAFFSRLLARETNFSHKWLQFSAAVTMLVGLVVAIALPIASHVLLPGEEWLGVLGLVPLVVGALCWKFAREQQYTRLARTFATGAVAFTALLMALVTQRVDRHQQSHELLAAIYARTDAPEVGYYDCLEPSWVFYGTEPLSNLANIAEHDSRTPELAQVANSTHWQPRRRIPIDEFLSASANRYVITTRKQWDTLQSKLGGDITLLAETPYFLKKKSELVVLGHKQPAEISTAERTLPERLERYR